MTELERVAFLSRTPPKNDPALFTPTRVRVKKTFQVGREPAKPGTIVELEFHVAKDMVFLGKAELV